MERAGGASFDRHLAAVAGSLRSRIANWDAPIRGPAI
jgi:hypothetical protein